MDYKQADALLGVLARIAEALEGIDGTLASIEDALNERRGKAEPPSWNYPAYSRATGTT